jgi:hypothetical protein
MTCTPGIDRLVLVLLSCCAAATVLRGAMGELRLDSGMGRRASSYHLGAMSIHLLSLGTRRAPSESRPAVPHYAAAV